MAHTILMNEQFEKQSPQFNYQLLSYKSSLHNLRLPNNQQKTSSIERLNKAHMKHLRGQSQSQMGSYDLTQYKLNKSLLKTSFKTIRNILDPQTIYVNKNLYGSKYNLNSIQYDSQKELKTNNQYQEINKNQNRYSGIIKETVILPQLNDSNLLDQNQEHSKKQLSKVDLLKRIFSKRKELPQIAAFINRPLSNLDFVDSKNLIQQYDQNIQQPDPFIADRRSNQYDDQPFSSIITSDIKSIQKVKKKKIQHLPFPLSPQPELNLDPDYKIPLKVSEQSQMLDKLLKKDLQIK